MPDKDRMRSRSRSRSPHTSSRRHRSRSPSHRDRERDREGRHSHSHRKRERSPRERAPAVKLPLNARQLSKHELPTFRAMFALYLDLQKDIDIETLSNDEVKGRWKSFMGKWNRGELAEGWYDPATKAKADKSAITTDRTAQKNGQEILEPPSRRRGQGKHQSEEHANEQDDKESDDDEYGPAPPAIMHGARGLGPAIPSFQDLQHRKESSLEDEQTLREDLRYERKMDRKSQKEALEDLVPRAEPGSRERQLEKKREAAASNRAFREARSPGAEDVGEKDLMGDDEDGIKRQIKEMDKKKSERELRKEEVLRTRAAEREERLKVHRDKENKTMDMLKAIARERFGAS